MSEFFFPFFTPALPAPSPRLGRTWAHLLPPPAGRLLLSPATKIKSPLLTSSKPAQLPPPPLVARLHAPNGCSGSLRSARDNGAASRQALGAAASARELRRRALGAVAMGVRRGPGARGTATTVVRGGHGHRRAPASPARELRSTSALLHARPTS